MATAADKVTFSFGQNWQDFLRKADKGATKRALKDIDRWLRNSEVIGKRLLDIGCGSGLHSWCFHQLGAGDLTSFDYDEHSVNATRSMWEKAGKPANWRVQQGSVLDAAFVRGLGQFDTVYSWGVLHHTGKMWDAIANAAECVKPGGVFWIALYAKGPNYEKDLALKRQYNGADDKGKRRMEKAFIRKIMWDRLKSKRNPFSWNERRGRGMNAYHDLVDWLGGLPYEVATIEEVDEFLARRGFVNEKAAPSGEGGCHVMLYKRSKV